MNDLLLPTKSRLLTAGNPKCVQATLGEQFKKNYICQHKSRIKLFKMNYYVAGKNPGIPERVAR